MADVALTADLISPVRPDQSEIYPFIAGTTITAGQAVAFNTSTDDDKLYIADANDGDLDQPVGIALEGGGAGQAIPVIMKGFVEGFTVSGIANFTQLWLSNTAGSLATTAAESTSVALMGRVMPNAQSTPRLLVYIDVDVKIQWA